VFSPLFDCLKRFARFVVSAVVFAAAIPLARGAPGSHPQKVGGGESSDFLIVRTNSTVFGNITAALSGFGTSFATTFTATSVPPLSAGEYDAILQGGSFESTGYVRLKVDSSGRGSVSVRLGNEANCVVLIGIDELTGTVIPVRQPGVDMKIDLRVIKREDGSTGVDGTIVDDGNTIHVTLTKTASPEAVKPLQGRYTFLIETLEPGTTTPTSVVGVGKVRVSPRGALRFAGRLGDGRTFGQGARLTGSDGWPLFARTSRHTSLSGTVRFADEPQTDLGGLLLSQKARRPAATVADLALAGSRYDSTFGFRSARQWLIRVDASGSSATRTLLPTADHSAFAATALGDALLNIATTTGQITGRLITQRPNERGTLHGVMFQKTRAGFGWIANGRDVAAADRCNRRGKQ